MRVPTVSSHIHPAVKGNARIFEVQNPREEFFHQLFLTSEVGNGGTFIWHLRTMHSESGRNLSIMEPKKVYHGFLCFRVSELGFIVPRFTKVVSSTDLFTLSGNNLNLHQLLLLLLHCMVVNLKSKVKFQVFLLIAVPLYVKCMFK